MFADLHVHSTASDGSDEPKKIVNIALSKGLSAIALTDHDTTDGIEAALAEARGTGLQLIPGVELNTDWEGTDIHILGYYIEYRAPFFLNTLAEMRRSRLTRAEGMLAKLADLGIRLRFEDVARIAGEAAICRPHIAQAMVEAGYVASKKEAFERYIGRGLPAYVPHSKLDPFTAIAVIEKAKGVPVLAHPGLADRDDLIPALVKKGLLGLEVYYPLHTPEMIEKYRWYSKKYGLVMTGGTDYHGPDSDYPPLGSVSVPMETVEKLQRLHSFID